MPREIEEDEEVEEDEEDEEDEYNVEEDDESIESEKQKGKKKGKKKRIRLWHPTVEMPRVERVEGDFRRILYYMKLSQNFRNHLIQKKTYKFRVFKASTTKLGHNGTWAKVNKLFFDRYKFVNDQFIRVSSSEISPPVKKMHYKCRVCEVLFPSVINYYLYSNLLRHLKDFHIILLDELADAHDRVDSHMEKRMEALLGCARFLQMQAPLVELTIGSVVPMNGGIPRSMHLHFQFLDVMDKLQLGLSLHSICTPTTFRKKYLEIGKINSDTMITTGVLYNHILPIASNILYSKLMVHKQFISSFSFSIDAATDRRQRKFFAVVARYVDDDFNVRIVNPGLFDVIESCTTEYLVQFQTRFLHTWFLPLSAYCSSIVADNASNMVE